MSGEFSHLGKWGNENEVMGEMKAASLIPYTVCLLQGICPHKPRP